MTVNFLPRPRASVLERDHRKNFEHELNGCALIQVNGGWLDLNQNGRVRGVLVFELHPWRSALEATQAYRLGFSPLRRASHDLCIMAQCSHVAYARRRNSRPRR